MNKAVMISIKEIHNANIESGKKVSELRTLPPNLKPPFKVYTYESGFGGRHMVVNEWICNNMITWRIVMGIPSTLPTNACVSMEEIQAYSGKTFKNITEMYISQLKIYDKPKELVEFKKVGYMTEEQWLSALYPNTHCHYPAWAKKFELTRPPQSWCYVEELKE